METAAEGSGTAGATDLDSSGSVKAGPDKLTAGVEHTGNVKSTDHNLNLISTLETNDEGKQRGMWKKVFCLVTTKLWL